jgi:diguanylate cyclase (GGDEF)-like protein/PAS domain S-box-containing protein
MSDTALVAGKDFPLLDRLEVGTIVLDAEKRVVFWNRWIERASGIAREAACGHPLADLFADVATSRLDSAVDHAIRYRTAALLSPGLNRPVLALYQKIDDRRHDRRMQQLVHVIPLQANTAESCLIQVQDVTAQVRRERRLRLQSGQLRDASYRDPLTGVGNQRRFDETLLTLFRAAQAREENIAVLMVDLDHLKAYNDHYGLERANDCLRTVAHALRDSLRQTGDLICRQSGGKFAIVLPTADNAHAGRIAERLRMQVESLMLDHAGSPSGHRLTVSIGAAAIKAAPHDDMGTLVTAADAALFQAKLDGRNRVLIFNIADGSTSAAL